MKSTTIPKLKDIQFGEIDANIEYYRSLKSTLPPAYEKAFVQPPLSYWAEFLAGDRFIIFGQKGTGKTALLRYIEREVNHTHCSSDFIEFKDEVLEESDLYDGVFTSAISADIIENTRHYLHTLKRIFLLKLLYLLIKERGKSLSDLEPGSFISNMVTKLKNSAVSDLVQLAFDTIHDAAKAHKTEEFDKQIDFTRLLKSQNDTLQKFFISQMKANDVPLRLFVDEVHFSLKDENSLQKDAVLVRDCIGAVINLNQSFIKSGIDAVIYLALRSEFLEHPVIAQAEQQKQVSSYGEELTWATYPNDQRHPVWNIAVERIRQVSPQLNQSQFFEAFLPGSLAVDVLKHSWVKPRDVIRFFKCAQKMYPDKISLTPKESKAVLRDYCIQAWGEVRTALSSMFDANGLNVLEEFLGENSEKQYAKRVALSRQDMLNLLKEATPDEEHLMFKAKMLYVLGVIVMERTDNSGTRIFNAYHRANLQPKWMWEIFFHQAVARRFS